MPTTREVLWGEALLVESSKAPRGLQGVVEAIHAEVGQLVGSRNTFAKLFRAAGPDELDERDAFRAWLLLAALGRDPADWGVPDSVVPRTHNIEHLGAALEGGWATYEPSPDDLQALRGGDEGREFDASDLPRWNARGTSHTCGYLPVLVDAA